jgi:short-subunit dehydrogenase
VERIVIVGASSGIGAALAVELARPGRVLGLVARREAELTAVAARARQKGATVAMAVADAGDTGTARPTWETLQAELGGIDTLVYAAGVMHAVGPREFDADKDLDMVRVNLSGAIAWIDLAAREFQQRGSGTICGIGSVAGDRGRQPSPVYGATKAGLHAYLESLAGRLWQDGVRVVTIKPGPVKTAMTDGRGPMPMMIDADVCARRIVLALERGEREVYVAWPWRCVMAALRCLPWWLFKRFRK